MAEPLVMLPPMMCDARVFSGILPALSRDRSVTVANLSTGTRMEDLATEVLAAAPARFAILGVELGGMVAMEIARRAPERLTRLALMSTTPLAESAQHAAAREPLVVSARAGRLADVMEQLRPSASFPQSPAKPAIMALLQEMARDLGPDCFARQTRALQRRRDQQPTLRKLRQPVMVIGGTEDGIYPPKRHRFMADLIPGAQLAMIDGAGHLPLLEKPDVTLHALTTWLEMPLLLR